MALVCRFCSGLYNADLTWVKKFGVLQCWPAVRRELCYD